MAVYFLFEFNKGVAAGLDVIALLEQINTASSMYVAVCFRYQSKGKLKSSFHSHGMTTVYIHRIASGLC